MIGETILNWKLKWNKNYSSIKRESKAYNQAKKIGVIIKNDHPKYNERIQALIRTFINDGKHVEVLCYQTKIINSKYNIPLFSFSKQELKWYGAIENSHFKKLLETKYDYLISISDQMDSVLNYILMKSPSLLRIGNAGVHNSDQIDMLVQKGDNKNLAEISDQIGNYLKQLK